MVLNATDPTYRIRAAAALSGVKEELIRAWERRYGVLSPRRTPGGYRVYTQEDIHVLRSLKKLTEDGVSIAEAARLLPQLKAEAQAPMAPLPSSGEALSTIDAWRVRILDAARDHDQLRVEGVLDEAFAMLPPLRILDGLVVPVMQALGEAWEQGAITIAQEHLVSQVIRMRLGSIVLSTPQGARRHVVAACFPDEEHEAGLLSACVRFRYSGWRVTTLGARVPAAELASICKALRPDCVALSCVTDPGRTPFQRQLGALVKSAGKGPIVVVGGRAAELHGSVVAELGARLVLTAEDWRDALV